MLNNTQSKAMNHQQEEEFDLETIIDSESRSTTPMRHNHGGRLNKKLSFSHTNNNAIVEEHDHVDNHHSAKSLKFRLRTSSFNKDGPVYAPVVETRGDQDEETSDSENTNKSHHHTDLKTSIIRLLSNSSGKQRLSPNHHIDGGATAGSVMRSNSIKIHKKNSDEALDDEKQELLFTFNKKKTRTQSYNRADDEDDISDDGLDSWEKDNEDEDDRVPNKIKKKTMLASLHKASPFSKSLDMHGLPMMHHVQSEQSNPPTPLSTSLKMTNNNMLTNIDSASSKSSSSSSGVGTDSSVSANNKDNNRSSGDIAAVGLIGGSVLYDKSNANVLIMEKGKKRSDSIRMRHGSYHQCTDDDDDEYSNYPGRKLGKRQRLLRMLRNRRTKNTSKNQPDGKKSQITGQSYLVIFILFVVNLLNYIDRFTLAGVLSRIQKYFDINDGESGLLQTVFICSYMLLAPLFGYLGDRYSRKAIIIFGISFWSFMTFIGSFVPKEQFWLFVIIRSLVGIGEASYSCIAPTIIGDLFTSEARTKMLGIFYLAVPVGSGMGYIVGSNVANAFDDWKWALRVTPPLGFLCVILLIFVVKEPKRGGADGGHHDTSPSSFKEDVIYLLKNKTFIWMTMGFTFASFVLGGLSWWVPIYVEYAILSNNKVPEQIPLLFGVVTCISGLLGVVASSVIVSKLRKVTNQADPLVCALGSLIAVPTLFVLLVITRSANQVVFWLIAAVAISAMCLSWTIVSDVLLYAIIPQRRSIASALNILITHLLGDAGSPYVIGAISDSLRSSKPDTYYNKFTSLQTALYAGPFFAAVSFAAYLFAAIYVDEDRKKVELYIKKSKKESDTSIVAQNPHLSSNNDSSNENSKIEDPTQTNQAVNLADSTSTGIGGSISAIDQTNPINTIGYFNPLVVTAESEKTSSDSR